MSRPKLAFAMAGGLVALLLIVWLTASRRSGADAADPGTPRVPAPTAPTGGVDPYAPMAPDRIEATGPAAPAAPDAPIEGPRGEALIAALRRIGVAFRAQDLARLQSALEEVVADPGTFEALLELWRKEVLRTEPEAALGAMIALEAGLVFHGRHEGVDPLQARSFVRSILMALPEIPEPERAQIIERLVAAQFAGRPILDARFLRDVLDLRMAWPDLRGDFGPLLANLGRGLEGEDGLEAFYAVLANEADDPLAVTLALSALLESGSETFLALAEQLFRESADPGLRAAVVRAVVTSLPVDRAAEAFVGLAGPTSHADAATLGARAGGLEAMRLAYERALAAGGASTKGREMLVVGMTQAPADELLEIASTDPELSVRGQAWITLTADREIDLQTMQALSAALAAGESNAGISPGYAASAAANVMYRGTASARAAARALLLEIASDTNALDWERRKAAQALEQHAPGSLPLELHGLLEGD